MGRAKNLNDIFAFIRYEINAYLSSPAFYAVVIGYLLIPLYLYFRSVYLSSTADTRSLFDTLSWALLIFVPALTMRQISEEKKKGTYEALLANPLKEQIIIKAKLTAVFLIVLMSNAFFLLAPAALSPFGYFDPGKVIGQFVGLNLIALFIIAVSIFASSATRNQYTSFLTSVILLLALYLLSADFILMALPASLRGIAEFLSPVYHFKNLSRGVIDASGVFYFIIFSWFFAYAASLLLMRQYAVKKKQKIEYITLWLLAIMILITGISLAAKLSFKLDLTREKLFTLTDSTEKIISAIDGKAVIKVYASRELPAQVQNIYSDVRDILSEYRRASRGKIEINYLQPDVNPKAKIEASNYGIPPIQFNVISEEEYKVKEGYFGVVVLYGGKSEIIPAVGSSGDFELKLSSALYSLTRKEKKRIGVVTDAGTKTPASGITLFSSILERQYEVEEVVASKKDEDLGKFDVLILAGPLTALEKESIQRIRKYIENGGSAFIAADPVRVEWSTMQGQEAGLNINEITGYFGLTLSSDVVLDLKNHESVVVGSENQYIIPYPFWVIPSVENSDKSAEIIQERGRFLLLWPSSVNTQSLEDSKVFPVLKTSSQAASQKGFFLLEPDQNFDAYSSRLKMFTLAAAAEVKKKGKSGRLFLIGDSEFLDDAVVQQNTDNLIFAQSVIHWLSRDQILAGLKAKEKRPAALSFPSKTVKEGVRYFVFALILILISTFGILYRKLHLKGLKEKYVS